jgi:protein-S-isoprenylcysteine O-methyltransferase Ste14
MTEIPRAAGVGVPPPVVFLGGLILGGIVNFFFSTPIWPGIWVQLLGVMILVVGLSLFATTFRTLGRHKTSPEPWEPTTELVQDGPYRFSRNPMYLSFALMYLGLSCVFNSLPALVLFVPVMMVVDRRQILREERYLEVKFDGEYRDYTLRVRRWV